MNSWKIFDNPVPLDKKHYYSELNLENISDSDLDHVKNVTNTFKIDNLGEYHDLFVKSDVALLADVFENFRDKCLKINKLDPAYYLFISSRVILAFLFKNGRSKIRAIDRY